MAQSRWPVSDPARQAGLGSLAGRTPWLSRASAARTTVLRSGTDRLEFPEDVVVITVATAVELAAAVEILAVSGRLRRRPARGRFRCHADRGTA